MSNAIINMTSKNMAIAKLYTRNPPLCCAHLNTMTSSATLAHTYVIIPFVNSASFSYHENA